MYSDPVSAENPHNDTLHALRSGYTVYNPFDSAVSLQFPPSPFEFPNNNHSKKRSLSEYFTLAIFVKSENNISDTVYCGLHYGSPDTIVCPSPPSFTQRDIFISKEDSSPCNILSYPVSDSPENFQISIYHRLSGPVSVSSRVISGNSGMSFRILEKKENGYELLSCNEFTLKKNGNSTTTLMVIAGRANSINTLLPSLSPNNSHSKPVRFKLTNGFACFYFESINTGIAQFELFDLQGKRTAQFMVPGINCKRQLKVVPGTYISRITYKAENLPAFSEIKHISIP